jgi:hypothetical protein
MGLARRAALAGFLLMAARGCGSSGSNVSRARGLLEVSPATLDFGNVPTGDERLAVLSLRNEGTGPIVFGGIAIDGDSRTAFTIASALATLSPGESTSLEVRYRAPEKEGPDGATLVIQSDADKTPKALVSLAGRSVTVCEPPLIRCSGACVNPAEDPGHCGACDAACESKRCAGGKCQPATCTDKVKNGAETSVDCGGPACPRCANGGGCTSSSDCQSKSCSGGKCLAPTCGDGAQNGDEIGVDCGGGCLACALGTPCSGAGPGCAAPDHAVGECKNGKCVFTCLPGFADCDRDPKNGCEVDLFRDVLSCGACGAACTGASAILKCVGGVCAVDRCSAAFGDCDKKASNGCETPLTTVSDCGACGAPCARGHASSICGSGTCELLACDAGFGNCDKDPANGCEADLATDARHCGQCARACAAAHAIPSCVAKSCAIGKCDKGFGDCNQAPGDGCETSLSTLSDCGGCGIPCAFANATASCPDGACELGACSTDFFDCDGNLATGCEIDLARDPANCGGCRRKCALPNAVAGCAAKSCTVSKCATGFEDCDKAPSTGCETPVTTLTDCGGCGVPCSVAQGTATCATGACAVKACQVPYADCDGAPKNGCETKTDTDVANCGRCGNFCSILNGTGTCVAGGCAVAGCASGFNDCDKDPKNGCEKPLNTVTDCGTCGVPCTVLNGTGTCKTGTCAVDLCNTSRADCDKKVPDGCEVDLQIDSQNCGSCGKTCKSNEDCVGGKCLCKVSCAPYTFRNCSEVCVPDGDGCHAWWITSCPLYERSCRTIYGHSFMVYCNRDPANYNCVRPELNCRPSNYCSGQGDGIPRCY